MTRSKVFLHAEAICIVLAVTLIVGWSFWKVFLVSCLLGMAAIFHDEAYNG